MACLHMAVSVSKYASGPQECRPLQLNNGLTGLIVKNTEGSHKKKLPNFGHRPNIWGVGSAAQPNLLSKKGMDMF